MESAAVRCVDRRVGEVLAQGWRVLVQVDDQLREIPSRRRELAHEQLVQARHVHRCLVDGFRYFKDEVVCWRVAE